MYKYCAWHVCGCLYLLGYVLLCNHYVSDCKCTCRSQVGKLSSRILVENLTENVFHLVNGVRILQWEAFSAIKTEYAVVVEQEGPWTHKLAQGPCFRHCLSNPIIKRCREWLCMLLLLHVHHLVNISCYMTRFSEFQQCHGLLFNV